MAFWSSGNVTNILITWSSGKCKTLYLNFPNFYGLQTWQSSNLRWTDPIFKVTWPSNYLVTWKMKKTYTSTFAIPMAIRLGRVVTYGQKTPHIKSCYLLFKWFHDKCKILHLHFRDVYDHQTWQSSNLHWTDPSFKAMRPFDHVITWQTKKNYICISTIHIATKLGRVVTYIGGIPPGHVENEKLYTQRI